MRLLGLTRFRAYLKSVLGFGHNPDLGLTTTWTGTVATQDEFVDTDGDRSTLLNIHDELLALDIGNSIPTNANQKFSGGTVQQWYVETTGSDSNDGSIGSPWLTIQEAWNNVPSTPSQNYQINVGAGIFLGEIHLAGKTINVPYYVRIVGAGPDKTILSYNQTEINAAITEATKGPDGLLDPPNDTDNYIFGTDTDTINYAHYDSVVTIDDEQIEFRGFRIIGARNLLPQYKFSECGIFMQHTGLIAGEKIILADLEISQVGHTGIKGGNNSTGTIIIDGVFLHDNGHGPNDHHIYPVSNGFEVRRSLFVNTDGVGFNGNDSERQSETLTHNIFIANEQGIAVAGKDWTVVHNVFYRNKSGGLKLYRAGIGGTGKNNVFYENVPTVTSQIATNYDTSGTTSGNLNRPHFTFDFDYNYVETGSSVVQLILTLPDDIESWAANTDFLKKVVLVTAASRYYEIIDYATNDETGGTAPTAESSWTTGITDGDVTLRYLGTSLTTNTYTNTTTGDDSAGAVFVDAANYNFRIFTGSDGDGAGTDLGYDNGDLPGVWLATVAT